MKKRVDSEKWLGILLATGVIVFFSMAPIRDSYWIESILAAMAGSV